MSLMDKLLDSFVKQQRMKLPGSEYIPCYRVAQGANAASTIQGQPA